MWTLWIEFENGETFEKKGSLLELTQIWDKLSEAEKSTAIADIVKEDEE